MGRTDLRIAADVIAMRIFCQAFGRRWYDQLMLTGGDVWTARDGRRIEIRTMDRRHAHFALEWLRRHAWHLHTACWQWMERSGNWIPEVGQELCLGPERWLERTPAARALRQRTGEKR